VPAFVAAWYIMNEWLASFEYHIEIGYFIFVLVFFSILILTVVTTGYFALKAANSNPADKLKYE
jgi:putative ABC transport system permease protein